MITNKESGGTILIVVMIMMGISMLTLGSVMLSTRQSSMLSDRANNRLEAINSAEAGLEKSYADFRTVVFADAALSTVPTLSNCTANINLGSVPSGYYKASDGYDYQVNTLVPLDALGVPSSTPIDSSTMTNLGQREYRYLSICHVKRNQGSNPIVVKIQREIKYTIKPLFQYAIFYNQDLELYNGPNMIIDGKVHSNGKLYFWGKSTGSVVYGLLTNYGAVSHVNGLFLTASLDSSNTSGSNKNTYLGGQPFATSKETPPGDFEINTNNPNTSGGARELIERPDAGYGDEQVGAERMYNKAGLKVIVNSTGGVEYRDLNNVIISNAAVNYPVLTNVFLPGKKMSDFRWNDDVNNPSAAISNVTTIDIDVGKLAAAANSNGIPGFNGIVYACYSDGSPVTKRGVRLINGASIPTQGLTVVTENPMYVVGDYNTGGTAQNVPSNVSNTGATFLSGASTKPSSSLMGDAITVVSSNWFANNYNTNITHINKTVTGDYGIFTRNAKATTINAAMIAGIVQSKTVFTNSVSSNWYSGGAHNYIRLLEDWSNETSANVNNTLLTVNGSMVNLFYSQQATTRFIANEVKYDYYHPPRRRWMYDTNFNDFAKLPPGTPLTRSIKKSQWSLVN
ncbi:MAG: hypothetical protein SGI71_09010 [Verrucomicrobiota bacterium]|nr:hypothetical protein [Verrucomicrobiota bacterium]